MPAKTDRHLKGISPVITTEDSYEEIVEEPTLEQVQEQENEDVDCQNGGSNCE